MNWKANFFNTYGWTLEDNIHVCGAELVPDSKALEEFSLRAFKAGENLVG